MVYAARTCMPIGVLDAVTRAYFAGLFDGEGSVSISLKRGAARWRPIHELSCVVSMTDRGAVRRLFEAFGGEFGGPYTRDKVRHKPQYRWRIISNHAVEFLQSVMPFLRVKRRQAEVGVAFQTSKIRYKITPQHEIDKRENFRQEMILLNKRHGLRPKKYTPSARLDAETAASVERVRRFKVLTAAGATVAATAYALGVSTHCVAMWRRGRLPKHALGETAP